MKLGVRGQLFDRYSRVGDRIDQLVEVDFFDLCERLGRVLADLLHVGWNSRNFRVSAAARLNEKMDGSFGMEADVDVEQPGQKAFQVQLGPQSLSINQVLEFLGLQCRSSGTLTLEFTLVKLKDHRQRPWRGSAWFFPVFVRMIDVILELALIGRQPQTDGLHGADLNAFDLDRGTDLQTVEVALK